MYQIELSEAALYDLQDFDSYEAAEILSSLQKLEVDPKPDGVQVIPLAEAADGLAYFIETYQYSIYYNIFEIANLVKIVAIFRRVNLN